jgi:hypothetical protein
MHAYSHPEQFRTTVVNSPPNPDPSSESLSVLAQVLAGEPRSILGRVCAGESPSALTDGAIARLTKFIASVNLIWPLSIV